MFSKVKTGVRALLRADESNAAAAAAPAAPPSAPPRVTEDGEPLTYDATNDTPCPPEPILALERCPVCNGAESTRVSKYNRFILFDRVPDAAAPVYNYALCHDCGAVYAQRRPAGARYEWLLERFE